MMRLDNDLIRRNIMKVTGYLITTIFLTRKFHFSKIDKNYTYYTYVIRQKKIKKYQRANV